MIARLQFAIDTTIQNCKEQPSGSTSCVTNLPQVPAGAHELKLLLSIAFGTLAAIAIVVIILAAINFANAGSDTEKIARQKRAILYALVGLAIATSAEAIVLTLMGNVV